MKSRTLTEFMQSRSPTIGYRGSCRVEEIFLSYLQIEAMLLAPDILIQQLLHTAEIFSPAHFYLIEKFSCQESQSRQYLLAQPVKEFHWLQALEIMRQLHLVFKPNLGTLLFHLVLVGLPSQSPQLQRMMPVEQLLGLQMPLVDSCLLSAHSMRREFLMQQLQFLVKLTTKLAR
jgi:hypothetical protein